MKTILLSLIFSFGAIFAADGQDIYIQKCQNCHGADGKLAALGNSSAIAGWDVNKAIQALNGYKNGTRNMYGMGEFMKNELRRYSNEELLSLANYISKLK
jgi:cytochrome c